jgi:glycosyltransferase involved in cell wall biosynthesis
MSYVVSVVIPAHNGERTVARALATVLAQQVAGTEILVIDDGSTDATAAVVSRIPGVKLIHQARQGVAGARNAGLAAATGQYVAFLDCDDEWRGAKLRKQLAVLDGDRSVGVVSSAAVAVDDQGRSRAVNPGSVRGRIAPLLLYRNIVVTSSVVLRRSCLDNVWPWFRTELCGRGAAVEDWEFWIRLAARNDFSVTEEPLVTYHVSAQSNFNQHRVDELKQLWQQAYSGLLADPVLGETVAQQWRALEANVDFFAACTHYEAGRLWRARREVIRSFVRAPFTPNWKSALAILLMTPRMRDLLKFRLEGW